MHRALTLLPALAQLTMYISPSMLYLKSVSNSNSLFVNGMKSIGRSTKVLIFLNLSRVCLEAFVSFKYVRRRLYKNTGYKSW